MPGSPINAFAVHHVIEGHSEAAVTANLVLKRWVCPFYAARIAGIMVKANTAGSGAGNTVVDVLKNGTTIWTTAGDRPALAAASTGEFNNARPNVTALQKGDVVTIQVVTVPATTGHAQLMASVPVEHV